MPDTPYTVLVVLDRDFGERLASLAPETPVWIIGSPSNTPIAHRLWKERPASNHLNGVTVFNGFKDGTPEEILLNELDTIDLHHGQHSADPPYARLVILGVPLTDSVKDALEALGFESFQQEAAGFSANRK